MSYNLFSYATKELSQDAFLRWFIAGGIKENNASFSEYSKSFVKELCFEDEKRDIVIESTKAQLNSMDIVVDFYLDKEKHILVIEDKTDTTFHDEQLEDYIKKANEWPGVKHFAYIKSGCLNNNEKNDVEKKGWKLYDAKFLYDFFMKVKSDNPFIIEYQKHITEVWKSQDFNSLSNRLVDWGYNEWRTFLRASKLINNPAEEWDWLYNGVYLSYCYYLNTSDKNHQLVLEMIVRANNCIAMNVHIRTIINEKESSWKCLSENDKIWNKALEIISHQKINYFKKGRRTKKQQTILSLIKNIDLKNVGKNNFKEVLKPYLNSIIEFASKL